MALTIQSGYNVTAGEVWTPTKHNLSTTIAIALATSSIMGRATVGPGAVEELTAAQVRTILGLATTDTPTFGGLVITGTAPSGTGITALFASPPALGGTAAAAVNATTLVASGVVNIGMTGGTYGVNLRGAAATGAAIMMQDSSDSNREWRMALENGSWKLIQSGVVELLVGSSTGITVTGTITSSGNMNAPVFNVTSARRFKKNIRDLAGIGQLLRLRPVWYDEKRAGGVKRKIGFIAEEVQKVLPSMVAKDGNGRVTALNYSQLVALAVAGLQDHEKRLAKLERSAA